VVVRRQGVNNNNNNTGTSETLGPDTVIDVFRQFLNISGLFVSFLNTGRDSLRM
jgi:hypothetical protein